MNYQCPFHHASASHPTSFKLTTTVQNLKMHLERWHKKELDALSAASENGRLSEALEQYAITPPTSQESHPYFIPKPPTGISSSQINQGLLVIEKNLSFSTVDSNTWAQMFTCLGVEEFVPISSHIFKTTLLPLFVQVVEKKISESLKDIMGIAISFDGWSDLSQIHYLGVAAHYLDKEDRFRNIILGVIPIQEKWHSSTIEQNLDSVIDKFVPKETIISATITDGASNMLRASDYFSGPDRIHCIDHIFHLIVNASLDCVSSHLEELRAFIRAVRKSPNLRRILAQRQELIGMHPLKEIEADDLDIVAENVEKQKSPSLMLLIDCVTRWGSTFLMLQRFLKLYPIIMSLEGNPDWIPNPIFPRDLLEGIKSVLETIYIIMKNAQSARCPCAGFIPSWIVTLLDYFDNSLPNISNIELKALVVKLKSETERRLTEQYLRTPSLPLQISCLLPFFGTLPTNRIAATTRNNVWTALKRTMVEILSPSDSPPGTPSTSTSSSGSEEDSSSLDTFQPSPAVLQLLSQSQISDLSSSVGTELDILRAYWSQSYSKGACFQDEAWKFRDPIETWKTDNILKTLITIFPAVRVLLSIPGSSARIESAFSHAGLVKSKLRNRMVPETVQNVLFVRLNIPNLYAHNAMFVAEVEKKFTAKTPFRSKKQAETVEID